MVIIHLMKLIQCTSVHVERHKAANPNGVLGLIAGVHQSSDRSKKYILERVSPEQEGGVSFISHFTLFSEPEAMAAAEDVHV